jgi:hypothetical protein
MATVTVSKPLEDALAEYKLALQKYERIAERECPAYSIVEIPKLAIADALLESLGLPTAPAQSVLRPTRIELEEAAARQKYREQ